MKVLTVFLGLPLLGLQGAELATGYRSDAKLRVTASTGVETEVVDFRMERDGEPFEGRGGRMGGGGEVDQQVVYVDEILAAVDGAPTELRRSFETLSRVSSSERGEHESEAPLEGVTLHLGLDADGEVRTEAEDGGVDEALLEGHRMRLPLDALLPEDAVEPGDEWPIEGESVLRALGFDLQPVLFPPGDESRPRDGGERGERRRFRGGRRAAGLGRLLADADWDGRATLLEGEEEIDGHACRTVQIELDAHASVERDSFGGRGDFRFEPGAAAAGTSIEFEAHWKGTLAFSAEEHRPVALEIEGPFWSESTSEFQRGDTVLNIFRREEGTYHHTVRIETES